MVKYFLFCFRRECSIRLKNNSTTSVVRIDAELCSEKYQGLVLDIIWQKLFKHSNGSLRNLTILCLITLARLLAQQFSGKISLLYYYCVRSHMIELQE